MIFVRLINIFYEWRYGICSIDHPFANQKVSIKELFKETLLVREEGSGTRAILEQILAVRSYKISSFHRVHSICNFEAMKSLIAADCGITFAYSSIIRINDQIATFELEEQKVMREVNYVYLKYTQAEFLVNLLEK